MYEKNPIWKLIETYQSRHENDPDFFLIQKFQIM